MENLLKKQTVTVSRPIMDCQEECAFSGDYMLPEYCPDVAVVLKCLVTPRVQNRQWSGEQLLLDGMAAVRVLYLDEERRCVRVAEFSQPISCALRAAGMMDGAPATLELTPKFVNCRAVSPRRLEVRGALTVHGMAQEAASLELPALPEDPCLFTRCEEVTVTAPVAMTEKILSVNETLDFPDGLPPAELLLGGDCRAVIRECKLLTGKAIVKGQVYFHQLYTDDTVDGAVYTLDFDVPFSQILDMDGALEGHLHTAHVSVLSDTEHCAAGPDGENTVLEVGCKLLVQLRLYEPRQVPLVLDAYHCGYPVTLDTQDMALTSELGCRRETTTLPMSLELPAGSLEEIVDVWAQPYPLTGHCEKGKAAINGRLLVSMLVRDTDGMISYYERPEEYQLEYACPGNQLQADAQITDTRYRAIDGKLELQLTLAVTLYPRQRVEKKILREAVLQKEQPYAADRATVKLYYAEPGETLWEIGRSCHTSPEAIREENDLQEEKLTRKTVLMIPMCV